MHNHARAAKSLVAEGRSTPSDDWSCSIHSASTSDEDIGGVIPVSCILAAKKSKVAGVLFEQHTKILRATTRPPPKIN